MKRGIFAAVLCSISSIAVSDGFAPTVPVKTFDYVSHIGAPPWTTLETMRADVEVFRNKIPNQTGGEYFIVEFIPKGETYESWSQLFALSAETKVDVSVEDLGEGQLSTYANACTSMDFKIYVLEPEMAVFMVMCGSYKNRPDTGEIALFRIEKHGDTMIKNYYHMRAPAYDPKNLATLKVDRQTLIDADEAIAALNVTQP